MSILYDVDTEKHTVAANASIDSLDAMTIILWYNATSMAVASHVVASKKVGTTAGFTFLRPKLNNGPDDWKFKRVRTTTDSLIETTGNIVQIGRWEYVAVADDTTAAPDMVHGTLVSRPTQPSLFTAATQGVGVASDDTANALIVGASTLSNQSANLHLGFVGMWNRRMTVAEMQSHWPRPHCTNGCVLFAFPGLFGGTELVDLSGSKNHGTVAGNPTFSVPPPFPAALLTPRRGRWFSTSSSAAVRRISLGSAIVGGGRTVLIG